MPRRFFYDTEFIEEQDYLQLISIGIVAEDGRELYCCNMDYDQAKITPWLAENVIPHLPPRTAEHPWGNRAWIRDQVSEFLQPNIPGPEIELYGWYSAYDHVLLMWLFGRMIDKPDGLPMYTRDLKQEVDRVGNPRIPDLGVSKNHDALQDARWNLALYKWLENYERYLIDGREE